MPALAFVRAADPENREIRLLLWDPGRIIPSVVVLRSAAEHVLTTPPSYFTDTYFPSPKRRLLLRGIVAIVTIYKYFCTNVRVLTVGLFRRARKIHFSKTRYRPNSYNIPSFCCDYSNFQLILTIFFE